MCVAKAMEHLSDFTFVSMANITLCRRDSFLAHLKSGLKQDTLAALRQATLDLLALFPDSVLKKAKDDNGRFQDKGRCHGQAGGRRDNRFHLYSWTDKHRSKDLANLLGNNWVILTRAREVVDSQNVFLTSGQGSTVI